MTVIDRKGVLGRLQSTAPLVIELGCGNRKRLEHAIGIDALDYDCVDVVGDVFEALKLFPDSSVDSIHSFHFFEHVSDVPGLVEEISRILKINGMLEVVVPHFSNPYFYSDCTHRTSFGLYTFSYFAEDNLFRRQVPHYQRTAHYRLDSVDLIFKSARPFYGRYAFKKIFGWIFNLNGYMKEFYEENLCYLFPCYEIRYRLVRIA